MLLVEVQYHLLVTEEFCTYLAGKQRGRRVFVPAPIDHAIIVQRIYQPFERSRYDFGSLQFDAVNKCGVEYFPLGW